jgi:DNA-binding NarL/FixJ family response regulator
MKTGVILESAADTALKSSDADSMFCIWLVDDDAYCREHLTWLLNAEPDVNCSRCFSTASCLLTELRQGSPPDAILIDLEMPVMNGIEAIAPIKKVTPFTMIVILTMFFDHRRKEEALAAGATDCILKRNLSAQIIAAIRAASVRFSSSRRAHVLAPQ